MTSTPNRPLKGIVPPLITPLNSDRSLDQESLERLVERVIAGGATGVFILGTTGEGPLLPYQLRREVIREVTRYVRSRIPILVGVTDTVFDEAVAMSRYAAEQGATAAVMAPPFYVPVTQTQLRKFAEELAIQSPLPLYIYNMPALTKVTFDLETIRRLRDTPQIIGVKDSSGDLLYFQRILQIARERSDWSVYMGPEELTAQAVLMGADGGVNGGANLFPSLFTQLYQAASQGDLDTTRLLQERVLKLSYRVYGISPGAIGVIQGLKGALACLQVCQPWSPMPFDPPDASHLERLSQALRECDVPVGG